MTGTATKLKTLDGWKGDASVYRLSPKYHDREFVIVSAVDLPQYSFSLFPDGYRTCETMIFACPDATGENVDYSDLVMVPEKSHAAALDELGDGYEIA